MKRNCLTVVVLLLLPILLLAEAYGQVPTPPNVSTLGPVIICSAGDSATNVKILSPQDNQNYSSNQVQLNFTVQALGMFGQFGNIGYSLDNGIIKSVTNFIKKTVDHPTSAPDWYWDRTTIAASIILPNLSAAIHNITVYYGWQYLGTNNPSLERFEVFAYDSVNFTIINTTDASPLPSPSLSPYQSSTPNSTITSTTTPTTPTPTSTPILIPTNSPPTSAPTSSPTQQPTPSPSAIPYYGVDYTPRLILVILVTLAVVVGLLVYFKKKRR